MNLTLLRTLVVSVPVAILFAGSLVLFLRSRSPYALLQLVGAGSVIVVVLTHVSEALHLFSWMGWGLENSPGHYLDLCSAVLAVTLFPRIFAPRTHGATLRLVYFWTAWFRVGPCQVNRRPLVTFPNLQPFLY